MFCCDLSRTDDGSGESVEQLSKLQPNVVVERLNTAIFNNDLKIFESVLNNIGNVEQLHSTVFDEQRPPPVEYGLLQSSPVLHTACMLLRDSMVLSLLEHGASVVRQNESKKYPVHILLQFWPRSADQCQGDSVNEDSSFIDLQGHERFKEKERHAKACLQHLLNFCSNVDARSAIHKNLLLHVCAKMHLLTPFEYLLSVGARMDSRELDGSTPLLVAAQSGATSVLRSILRQKGNINTRNAQGRNVLHLAAIQPNISALLFSELIDAGAGVDITDRDGNSPLHLAAETNQYRKMHILIDHDCNCDLQNGKGLTALNVTLSRAIASDHGYRACIHLMQEMTVVNVYDEAGSLPLTLRPGSRDEILGQVVLQYRGQVPTLQTLCCQRTKVCLGRRRRTREWLDHLSVTHVLKCRLALKSEIIRLES